MRNKVSPPRSRKGRRFRVLQCCRCGCGKVLHISTPADAVCASLAAYGSMLAGMPARIVIDSRSIDRVRELRELGITPVPDRFYIGRAAARQTPSLN